MISSVSVALCLLSAPLRADVLSAAFASAASQSRAAIDAAKPARAFRGGVIKHPEQLPENCANLPVVSIRNGEISKNGVVIGRNAQSYQANCDGLVAWKNSYGELYRGDRRVASNISQYDVAWFGDVIVWRDSSGELSLNGDNLGRVQSYTFVKYTGDVVWQDGWGELNRNREKFGRAQSYAVAARTGDVAWVNGFGVLHRNGLELGRAQSWKIADRTGDVGWLTSFRELYKNGVKVASGVDRFEVREDGKVIWVDSWGNTHYA